MPLLARGRARPKITEVKYALESVELFTRELAALHAKMLGRIDQLNVCIDKLAGVVEILLKQ